VHVRLEGTDVPLLKKVILSPTFNVFRNGLARLLQGGVQLLFF
jgi:hypothetical protein